MNATLNIQSLPPKQVILKETWFQSLKATKIRPVLLKKDLSYPKIEISCPSRGGIGEVFEESPRE